MDHNCRVLGFLGMDKYEYIMYLSRILFHLGKKVLMVDSSESGALTSSIRYPEGMNNSVIEYRGVMFLDNRVKEDKEPYWEEGTASSDPEYDCVLIDYGYHLEGGELNYCDRLICVTDQQVHNMNRISKLKNIEDKKKMLIIKDVVNSSITPSYIIGELEQQYLTFEQVYIVFQDEVDTKCRIHSQYDGRFRFIKLSMQSQNVIKGLVGELFPEITKKEIEAAYKKAEKGV